MAWPAVAQEVVCTLRLEIARIEGTLPERLVSPSSAHADADAIVLRRSGMPARNGVFTCLETGSSRLDEVLGGGLPKAALTEIHSLESRNAGAAAGFVLALASRLLKEQDLPLLWIGTSEIFREAGLPHAPGLAGRFGIPPERLLISEAPKLVDALWVAEEAARLTALGAVVLELRGNPQRLDLVATRRLHRRAQDAGRPVFLLRQAGAAEPTAAPVRLVVGPAPAAERRILSGALTGSIGPPVFTVAIDKSTLSMPAELLLEWNADERAFHEREAGKRRAPDTRPVVPLSDDGTDSAAETGQVLAFEGVA